MSIQKSNPSKTFLLMLDQLPLWVKQIIYLELRQEMIKHFASQSLDAMVPEDSLAMYAPKITDVGEGALGSTTGDEAKLLTAVRDKYTVLDMCINYEWTLEEACAVLRTGIENKWVRPPESSKALGTLEYLANAIRLGEYLVKMDRITPEQLNQALRTQQYIEESMREHTGLANILINLGYITRQDTEGILFLKEESRKPMKDTKIFKSLEAAQATAG